MPSTGWQTFLEDILAALSDTLPCQTRCPAILRPKLDFRSRVEGLPQNYEVSPRPVPAHFLERSAANLAFGWLSRQYWTESAPKCVITPSSVHSLKAQDLRGPSNPMKLGERTRSFPHNENHPALTCGYQGWSPAGLFDSIELINSIKELCWIKFSKSYSSNKTALSKIYKYIPEVPRRLDQKICE